MLQKIKHLFQRFGLCCKAFPGNIREFGSKIALVQFWDVLIPTGKSKYYIETLSRYMCRELESVVEECNAGKLQSPMPLQQLTKVPVWVCWWQGEAAMPPIVRACVEKLRRSLPDNAQLHLITWDNVKEYIALPQHVLHKNQDGIIGLAHLSDVLRFGLLSIYGGLWIDSTVYMSKAIPSLWFDSLFYTQKFSHWIDCPQEACRGLWCGFFIGGAANNTIFVFLYEALCRWWSKHNRAIDYVLFDYILWAGYCGVPTIRATIDGVAPNNPNIWLLAKHLNDAYEPEAYQKMMESNGFFKLSYKGKLEETTADGKKTVYRHILEENER